MKRLGLVLLTVLFVACSTQNIAPRSPTNPPRATFTPRAKLAPSPSPTFHKDPTLVPTLASVRMGVSSTYDKFKDETTVFTFLTNVSPVISVFRVEYTYKGETPAASDNLFFSIKTEPSSDNLPHYGFSHDLIFLLDDKTRLNAQGIYDPNIAANTFQEIFVGSLPSTDFSKFAKAKKIEVRFGDTVLHLTPDNIADLKDIASRANQ